MPPELHFDVAQVDCTRIVADREAIRLVNPQRFEIEQLDAIVHVDTSQHLVIGYKDVALRRILGQRPHAEVSHTARRAPL